MGTEGDNATSDTENVTEHVEDRTVDPVVDAASSATESDVLPPVDVEIADSPAPESTAPTDGGENAPPETVDQVADPVEDAIADDHADATTEVNTGEMTAEQTTQQAEADVTPGSGAAKEVTRDTRPRRKLGWRRFILGGSGGTS